MADFGKTGCLPERQSLGACDARPLVPRTQKRSLPASAPAPHFGRSFIFAAARVTRRKAIHLVESGRLGDRKLSDARLR